MFRALRHRNFRLLIAGTSLVGLVQPLHFVTQIFWVQDVYPERQILYTGLLAGSRGLATLLFSLLGGAFADRFERRRVLLACESVSLVLNVFVAILMLSTPFGEATILGIIVLTFFAAATQAVDLPARQASLPAVVGMDDLGNAISLNMAAQQISIPITIPLAAVLAATVGPGELYAGSLVVWAGILPLIALLDYESRGGVERGRSVLGSVADGLAYIRHHVVIFGAVALVFVMNAVGMPAVANLGVIWMTEILNVSRAGFALMALGWGGGAVAGSIFFARRPELAGRGTTLCLATLVFAICTVVFAHSRSIPLTALVNVGLGFSLAASSVSATMIIQQEVSDEMRGRVMGLFPLTNGIAMLITMPISGIAQGIGLPIVLTVLGWTTLALAAAIVLRLPDVRRVRPRPVEEYAAAAGGG